MLHSKFFGSVKVHYEKLIFKRLIRLQDKTLRIWITLRGHGQNNILPYLKPLNIVWFSIFNIWANFYLVDNKQVITYPVLSFLLIYKIIKKILRTREIIVAEKNIMTMGSYNLILI